MSRGELVLSLLLSFPSFFYRGTYSWRTCFSRITPKLISQGYILNIRETPILISLNPPPIYSVRPLSKCFNTKLSSVKRSTYSPSYRKVRLVCRVPVSYKKENTVSHKTVVIITTPILVLHSSYPNRPLFCPAYRSRSSTFRGIRFDPSNLHRGIRHETETIHTVVSLWDRGIYLDLPSLFRCQFTAETFISEM